MYENITPPETAAREHKLAIQAELETPLKGDDLSGGHITESYIWITANRLYPDCDDFIEEWKIDKDDTIILTGTHIYTFEDMSLGDAEDMVEDYVESDYPSVMANGFEVKTL